MPSTDHRTVGLICQITLASAFLVSPLKTNVKVRYADNRGRKGLKLPSPSDTLLNTYVTSFLRGTQGISVSFETCRIPKYDGSSEQVLPSRSHLHSGGYSGGFTVVLVAR